MTGQQFHRINGYLYCLKILISSDKSVLHVGTIMVQIHVARGLYIV